MSNREPWLARAGRGALGWLEQDCALCGAGSGTEPVCGACADGLPSLPEACPQCALPTPGGALCGACLAAPPHFDSTVAVWLYEFPCDRLVQALKYHARLALAPFFARRLAERPLPQVDLVIPMPLHPKRLARRGFNQALEVARVLARRTGRALEPRGAERVRDTIPQTDLPLEERARNIRGAFASRLDFSGKTVAVVDDVMTTGATLNELARILKRAGASGVHNLVLSRSILHRRG